MSEQLKRTFKECALDNWWFKILSIVAMAMLVISMFLPPQGVIDPSVIAGVGEIFAFAALWSFIKALDRGHTATLTHGDTTVTVKKHPDETENE